MLMWERWYEKGDDVWLFIVMNKSLCKVGKHYTCVARMWRFSWIVDFVSV